MELKIRKLDGWKLHALEFENDNAVIMKIVLGKLINIQTKSSRGENQKLKWQQKISNAIKSERGSESHSPSKNYAISLGMKFSRHENQNQPIDIDNFIKPIFAGIAAGLFTPNNKNPKNLDDFKSYDDSCFRYLYVERLSDHADKEGVTIIISKDVSE